MGVEEAMAEAEAAVEEAGVLEGLLEVEDEAVAEAEVAVEKAGVPEDEEEKEDDMEAMLDALGPTVDAMDGDAALLEALLMAP